jgi:nucleotide-binding universal stress UspA family protein
MRPVARHFSRASTEYRDQALANMQNMLEKTAAPLERTSTALANGNARFVTSASAVEWGADLIVLGKHGYSLIGELFLGGVTRHTVARATCDVAVVPDWPRL